MLLDGFLFLAAAFTSDIYVDANAVAPGDGSAASPFTDLQDALDLGGSILVAPGVYVGPFNTHGFGVALTGTGGPLETRLEGSILNGGQLVLLEGFTVHGSLGFAFSPTLRRCVFDGTGIGSPAVMWDSTILIENCTFVGWGFALQEHAFTSSEGVISNVLIVPAASSPYCAGFGGSSVYNSVSTKPASGPTGGTGFTVVPDAGLWSPTDPHLAPLSVCIDAGNPLQTDPDGSRIDVGAIPYDPTYAATPTTYCTPKTTSKGCAPLVTWTGSASLSGPDDFFLTASPALNKKVGKFIWGTAPKATPFAGGSLCVKLPFVRGPHLDSGGSTTGSDCTGVYTWHFSQAYMAQKGVTAGSILYAQAWGRDQGFAAPNNSQLSNAIVFQVAP